MKDAKQSEIFERLRIEHDELAELKELLNELSVILSPILKPYGEVGSPSPVDGTKANSSENLSEIAIETENRITMIREMKEMVNGILRTHEL